VKQAGADSVQWVICRVDQEDVGIDILHVQELHRMMEITLVPKASPFVEGVITLYATKDSRPPFRRPQGAR
jgi:chemotaxis signal transduction protein